MYKQSSVLLLALFVGIIRGDDLKTCERDYLKIGCYEERNARSSDLLINDRHNIKWNNIVAYMHHLACICSQAVKDANTRRPKDDFYVGFGLHYFGECYGKTKNQLDALADKGQSHRCIGDQTYTKCEAEHSECVGHDYAEYIYKLRMFTGDRDIDGGYSSWEQWSSCEGQCGMGIRRRERTCTQPEPRGDGRDCSSLGNSTETKQCYTGKKCPEWISKEFNMTACEGESLSIECRGDAEIKITDAMYGRLSLDICKRWYENNWKTSCRAKKALVKVKKECERKTSCFLYANTGVFGEPCFGTEKYLQVNYRCKSRE